MLGEIRAEGGDGIFGHGFSPSFKGLDQSGQRTQVMEDETVGHKVVVFDGLPLLIPAVLRDDAFAAEEDPLEESVEGFALVGCALDGRTQLRVRDVAEQEAGADDAA